MKMTEEQLQQIFFNAYMNMEATPEEWQNFLNIEEVTYDLWVAEWEIWPGRTRGKDPSLWAQFEQWKALDPEFNVLWLDFLEYQVSQ